MSVRKNVEESALQRAVSWLFDEGMFVGWKRHGNTKWSLPALVHMALFWAWGPDDGLQQRFHCGLAVLVRWHRSRQWGLTYQGFVKILQTWSGRLIPALSRRLRERMQELARDEGRICGHVLMAVDGTRIEAPRTQANEVSFARIPAHRTRAGKSPRARASVRRKVSRKVPQPAAPQVWLTVIWHMGCGLLWDWRQGPSGSSERAHLREMLDGLPDKTLLVADAGFQGYD